MQYSIRLPQNKCSRNLAQLKLPAGGGISPYRIEFMATKNIRRHFLARKQTNNLFTLLTDSDHPSLKDDLRCDTDPSMTQQNNLLSVYTAPLIRLVRSAPLLPSHPKAPSPHPSPHGHREDKRGLSGHRLLLCVLALQRQARDLLLTAMKDALAYLACAYRICLYHMHRRLACTMP